MIAIPFAVDINKVKNVFGSKDRNLLEGVKSADLYEHYSGQSEDFQNPEYQYDFDQVLEDIIFNYIKKEDRKTKSSFWGLTKSVPETGLKENLGHGYGYALLVICDYLGTHLLPLCDGFYYGRDFKTAAEIMMKHGLEIDITQMVETHEIFDIPKIADFPAIHCYSKQEIEHINSILDKIQIDESKTDYRSEDFDEVQEMLQNIKESFRTCKEQNVEMITFTH